MKTKKLLLGLGLALLGTFSARSQGLENIIVEKFYVSNAADAAGSVGTLPTGSVTYRIYADLLPGYKFQALYGVASHELKITTTTTFFNNEDRGAIVPNGISVTNTRKNSVYLDSWFSVGATAAGKMGVIKTEDTDGALSNTDGILQNNDPSAGIPINTQDGMITGTPEAVTFVGLTTELDVFDATSQVGGSFSTTNGSIASLNGSVGPTATNRVLIGQFTTDGVFGFELNIQIGTPSSGTENYVAKNPVGAEISIPSLTLAPNLPPSVSVTAPVNGANFITGDVVAIAANASDSDGTVSSVEFFVDAVSIGVDNTAPYTANYTSTLGSHNITAKATDDDGDFSTSSVVTINVANNQAPAVNITSPANGASFVVGDVVAIAANASDVDGTVASVEFFVDAVSIGVDNSAPFTANYASTLGGHSLTAKATDDRGAQTTSSVININVINNVPPSASITAPTAGSAFTAPAVVTINANASDADGTVTQVEFFVNNVSIGLDADGLAPYTINWTSVIGAANLTAKATDNKGAVTTSPVVSITIADPNALPYRVGTLIDECLVNTFCLPVEAVDTVQDIIGYDMVLDYDETKVMPTGVITVSSDLINPTYVDVINSIDTVNGKMIISAFLNSFAPASTNFNGTGDIFCVEFNKTAGFASVDTAIFSIPTLDESYFVSVNSKLVEDGKIITFKDSLFSASLKFWADNSPIKYDLAQPNDYLITNIYGNDATCNNLSATAVQPDLAGNFVYNTANGLNVDIQRDILATTDVQPVVNGFDALQTRKVLLNDLSFIPNVYQMVAMDVNMDGVISAGDVSQINQRAVLIIPEFRQAWNYNAQGISNGELSKDWLFIDSSLTLTTPAYQISATYPLNDGVGYSKARVPVVPFCLPVPVTNYAVCPLIQDETYRGVLLGDVNGNYQSIAPDGVLRSVSKDKVVFDLSKAIVKDGYVNIPVSVVSDKAVNALDFAMQFDENLKYNSVVDHTSYMQVLDNFNVSDKTLRFTSNSLQKYDISQPLVSVRFATNSKEITEADFTSLAGYLNGDKVNVEIVGAVTGISTINNNTIVNVYPNPATGGLLTVEVSENATIQLTDIDGKEVVLQSNVNGNQKQELNVENLANGVYIMKVYNDNFISVKKVVINN